MSTDPIAYSLAALDKQNGKVSDKQLNSKVFLLSDIWIRPNGWSVRYWTVKSR